MSVVAAGSKACGEVAVVKTDLPELSGVEEDVQVAGTSDRPAFAGSKGTPLSVLRPVEVGASSTWSSCSGADLDLRATGSEVGGVVAGVARSRSMDGCGLVGSARCDAVATIRETLEAGGT